MVALLPLVPGVSILAMMVGRRFWNPAVSNYDEWFAFQICSAVLGTAATIFLWRRLVIWTLGRGCMTAVVALVPFAQVLYPYPLWSNPGCMADDILRMGQHSLDAGLWVWLTVWVWWGWEKRTMSAKTDAPGSRLIIGDVHRRILCSVGYVPMMVGVFVVIAMAVDKLFPGMRNPNINTTVSYALAALPGVAIWIILWNRGSTLPIPWWSPLGKALICIALPIVVVGLRELSVLPFEELYVLPLIGWGAWMIWTANTWVVQSSDGAAESSSPQCLRCGYLLSGLKWTRCPECGDEPTLDELWNARVAENA